MNATTFAEILVEWRERHGYSAVEAAAVLGCGTATFHHWVAERIAPNYFAMCAVVRQMRDGHDPLTDVRMTATELADTLKEWRDEHGFSQRQAAVAIGTTAHIVRGWESQDGAQRQPALAELLRRLRMPVDAARVKQVTKRPLPIEPQRFAKLFRAWRRRHRLTRDQAAAALRAVTSLRTTGRTVLVWETARALPKRPLFVIEQLTALADRPPKMKTAAEMAAHKFRRLLRRWRKARGLNQSEACALLGLSNDQAPVSNYERGKATPRPERMRAMLAIITGTEVQP